jgi:ribose 5-phosphate isomerase A
LDTESLKRQAAESAAAWIEDGMTLGLGTGSTVKHLLAVIGEGLRDGRWRMLRGVPTSAATQQEASALGIPLVSLEEAPELDLTLDGADEVDPELRLIKGLGAALLREKIVARASRRMVALVDETKVVDRLGTRAPLPVEVDPFGWTSHIPTMEGLGSVPTLRRTGDGQPLRTDGGHFVVDCHFPDGIADPEMVELRLRERPGVIATGLFLHEAVAAVVASPGGTRTLRRAESR